MNFSFAPIAADARVLRREPVLCRSHGSAAAFVCLFLMLSPNADAAVDEIGIWTAFVTTDTFTSDEKPGRWSYWLDAQARYYDLGSGINQQLLRPMVGYRLRNTLQVWLGYARIRSKARSGIRVDENRFIQQLNWTVGQVGDGTLTLRARLLQRSVSAGDDLGWVLRVAAKYAKPIGKTGRTSLILGLEPIAALNDTDWGGESRLVQNRSFLGVGWRVNSTLTLETGYMNQYLWRDSGDDISNHLAIANFKVSFR